MRFRIFLVVASCLLSLITGYILSRGVAPNETKNARAKPLIGLSLDTLKEERWQRDRDLFVARATNSVSTLKCKAPTATTSAQVTDVQSLITDGVDVIVIAPHNGDAMAKAVHLAHEAGIPVLAYDRLIRNCDLDLYMTFDNFQVGELQAQYLVDALAERRARKKRSCAFTAPRPTTTPSSSKQGQDKVLQPLIDSGEIEVVHEDWADDWKPENAKKIANAGINKAGHNFDAILASNDGTAGGAIQALIEEGLAGKVLVTGQDADLAACQRIVDRHAEHDHLQAAEKSRRPRRRVSRSSWRKPPGDRRRQLRQRPDRGATDAARCRRRDQGQHEGNRG